MAVQFWPMEALTGESEEPINRDPCRMRIEKIETARLLGTIVRTADGMHRHIAHTRRYRPQSPCRAGERRPGWASPNHRGAGCGALDLVMHRFPLHRRRSGRAARGGGEGHRRCPGRRPRAGSCRAGWRRAVRLVAVEPLARDPAGAGAASLLSHLLCPKRQGGPAGGLSLASEGAGFRYIPARAGHLDQRSGQDFSCK